MEEWGRDEQELVRRCKEGSEAAYAVLVRLHRPRLYTLAYRLLLDREAAEDAVQETFISAFRQMERFEPRPSLAAWLNTIALRTAGRAAARQRTRPRTSLDAPTAHNDGREPAASTAWAGDHLALADTDPAVDPIAAAESADLRRELSSAIAALPFKYRAAVVVRHVLGLDYAEAARELDIPLNTFKSNLLRGTKMLRESLAAQLDASAAASSGGGPAGGRPVGAASTATTATRAATARTRTGSARSTAERATAERATAERQTPDHPAPERIARG